MDLNDVLVRQRGVDARLDLQHLHESHVLGEAGQDALDDDQLLEAFLAAGAAEVQLGHGADGKTLEELVVSKPAVREKRHGGPHGGGWPGH